MQVQKEHYTFDKYADMRRWCSYYYQIHEALTHNVTNILLIGEGDGIVSIALRKLGAKVTSFDFAEDLKPDIIGDIRNLEKFVNKDTYDCIICCQVLEHLEYKYFDNIIKSFNNIIRKDGIIILSLPQDRVWIKFYINIAWLEFKKVLLIPIFWRGKYKFNGEHYWEVSAHGLKQVKKKKIINQLKQYFKIEKQYTSWEFPYHWFVILKPYINN